MHTFVYHLKWCVLNNIEPVCALVFDHLWTMAETWPRQFVFVRWAIPSATFIIQIDMLYTDNFVNDDIRHMQRVNPAECTDPLRNWHEQQENWNVHINKTIKAFLSKNFFLGVSMALQVSFTVIGYNCESFIYTWIVLFQLPDIWIALGLHTFAGSWEHTIQVSITLLCEKHNCFRFSSSSKNLHA